MVMQGEGSQGKGTWNGRDRGGRRNRGPKYSERETRKGGSDEEIQERNRGQEREKQTEERNKIGREEKGSKEGCKKGWVA